MAGIFDSHAHYDDLKFKGILDETIEKLKIGGVIKVMNAACSVGSTIDSIALCEKDAIFSCSAGIHPGEIDGATERDLYKIEELGKESCVRAIGEIGLDYHYEGIDKERQKYFFISQLDLAKKLSLPVIIHSREATKDVMEILRKYRPEGVVHCFSGSADTAKELIDMGMFIGFTGVVTFQNARKAVESAAVVPIDRLLIETDAPYMAPVPFRGQLCDSSMLTRVANKLAEIKGISEDTIIEETAKNAASLFNITL